MKILKYTMGEFVTCPRCLATSFSAAPHGTDACPLVVEEHEMQMKMQAGMLESELLKADTERNAMVKGGVWIEDMAMLMHKMYEHITGESADDDA